MKNTETEQRENIIDELDDKVFYCKDCGKACHHTEGTWLPIEVTDPGPIQIDNPGGMPLEMSLWMQQPEVITSDKFTCYDCL